MTITVHHLNNSRSQRMLWLLEELNVPYEIVHHQRDAVTNLAPEALLKIHPLGKSPMIEDAGNIVFESGAIVEYLCERHMARIWCRHAGQTNMSVTLSGCILPKARR